jgi:Flp pilus assembly protein TadG
LPLVRQIRPQKFTAWRGLARRLLRDRSGNTLAIIAAAIAPLLALVGGSIDMGRSYLSESRLQQACDAGVLAARKKLGSTVVTTGTVPSNVATAGNKFFNLNFRSGTYGTANRNFAMTLEPDYSISGVATVDVPTTIMRIFAFDKVAVRVVCQAKLNYTNTDVMMVLDVTGSMNQTNPSDSQSKISILKTVVSNFHTQLEGSKGPGTRVRYGFVPYSVNVNVGALLRDDWVVGNWTYQSREEITGSSGTADYSYWDNWATISGSYATVTESTYPATWNAPTNENSGGWHSCNTPAPAGTYNASTVLLSTTVTPWAGPPKGNKTVKRYRITETGSSYSVELWGTTCTVRRADYSTLIREYDEITIPTSTKTKSYRYAPIPRNVTNWRNETNGCIEERGTYEIADYSNVDFSRALDLDLDRVPTPGMPETQWRPAYPDAIWGRSLDWYGNGSFSLAQVVTTDAWFFKPTTYGGLVACPAPARKLAEMTGSELSAYLGTISASGGTYHDIGMIWGGRLLSPNGIFAADNADVSGQPTNRHLIFLTDGLTAPNDIAYGAYGIEPLDRRRWSPGSTLSLTKVVENRFTVACDEVKKRNITVWVIGFGINMPQLLKNCAGSGRWFQADDAGQLNSAFAKIAASMGDLRISK